MIRAPLVAAVFAAATPAMAQERFLRIEVDGALPEDTKAAIERVFVEAEIRKARQDAAGQQTSLEQLCAQKNCSTDDAAQIDQFVKSRTTRGLTLVRPGQPTIPGVTIDGENFIAVPRVQSPDPVVEGPVAFSEELEFIPYNNVQIGTGNARVVARDLQSAVSPTLDVISDDLQVVGKSSRQIPIPPHIDETTIASLNAAVATTSASQSVSFGLEFDAAKEFQISLAEEVTFETNSGADACEADDTWPFDASEVAEIIDFNFDVLERLGVTRLRRSRVLIMDTGLGAGLSQDTEFKRFLDMSLSEALYANTYFESRTSLEDDDRQCLDADGLTRSSDAYGFAIEQTGNTPPGFIPVSCRTHSPLDRILALLPLEGAEEPPYVPEHGSFVAALALGGPSLIEASDRIEDLVGLTFARITDAPNSPQQTVRTEVSTLGAALGFAAARDVDVLNASIRVEDSSVKSDLQAELSGFDGIIVAAAGNFPEPITSISGSFPASVTDSSFDDRLIVVGALKNSESDRYWEQSARHHQNVDIAAPGANITSLDLDGNLTCKSGTSAAAPLVSFVAASLKTFGVRSPVSNKGPQHKEVLHRIFATAELDEDLKATMKVKDGRVLDVATALDVFVDHIWTEDDPKTPMRVLLQREDQDETKPVFLQACKRTEAGDLAGIRGAIDANVLAFWHRKDGGDEVDIWHRIGNTLAVEEDEFCKVADRPNDRVHFLDLADNQVKSLAYTDIRRIALSPFRTAIPTVRIMAQEN